MIDFHTHAFPDQLAERALTSLSRKNGGIIPYADGTLGGLRQIMHAEKISHAVVLSIATRPEQETAVNRFAIENQSKQIFFFGSLHPRSRQVDYLLDLLCDAGIKGVKFHPEYQDFHVDDPDMQPIYRAIARRGLITVFHAGLDLSYDRPGRCRPAALARILPWFEGATVIAAHLGGYMLGEEVERHLIGKAIYLDTSYSYSHVPMPMASRLIRSHGADRVLFGSDSPWSSPGMEKRYIQHLDLEEQEKTSILENNARILLGLEP